MKLTQKKIGYYTELISANVVDGSTNNVKPCVAGNYCNGDGYQTPCAGGTFTAANLSSTCTKCSKSTYLPNLGNTGPCLSVESGYYTLLPSANEQRTPCPAGSKCSGNGFNVLCSKGQYSPTTLQFACSKCESGKYADTTGSTGCLTINPGFEAINEAVLSATGQIECTGGTYSPGAIPACTHCTSGSYSTAIAATNDSDCRSCVAGQW
jgi:hypothetical protein